MRATTVSREVDDGAAPAAEGGPAQLAELLTAAKADGAPVHLALDAPEEVWADIAEKHAEALLRLVGQVDDHQFELATRRLALQERQLELVHAGKRAEMESNERIEMSDIAQMAADKRHGFRLLWLVVIAVVLIFVSLLIYAAVSGDADAIRYVLTALLGAAGGAGALKTFTSPPAAKS